MLEMTPFCCPKSSCQKKIISDSWQLKHVKLHHPEHLQVARQNNETIRSTPRRVEPAQCPEFNTSKDSAEHLDPFPYLKHCENIADKEFQPPPSQVGQTETYPGAGTPLSDVIAEPWECDAHGCVETNLQSNPYYPFAMREEYISIQCGINMKHMKTYHDNLRNEVNTFLCFPTSINGDGVQKLVASMPDVQALGEWELHTLQDMRWNDNHQLPIRYWSQDIIIKTMSWLMW